MANKKSKNFRYGDSQQEESEPVDEQSTTSGEVATSKDVDNTKQAGVASVKQGQSSSSFASFNRGGE